jgi:hypothetical protein
MPRKVVPGSITEPYKIGQGDFSPNLVGLQFTEGTTLFTLGNFSITTNTSGQQLSRVYSTGSFSESYTLETLGITTDESESLSNNDIKTILNIDCTNLERFVYFGSFYEYISTVIEQIILKWKGSLFLRAFNPLEAPIPKNTVLNYTYDVVDNVSYFKIPHSVADNRFGLIYPEDFGTGAGFNNNQDLLDISNLNINYNKYEIYSLYGNFSILGYTGGTNTNPYISVKVKGNSWPALKSIGFGSFDYHIRPKEETLNKYFFSQLDEFENNVLNRLTTPKYTAEVRIPKKTDKGTTFFSVKNNTWPTSDGYNIDIDGTTFTSYVNTWLDIARDLDNNKTDLIARRFITASIIEFDTEGDNTDVYGRKVNKLLRIYGREFDEIKKYVDALSFSRRITYNKKDNAPDELIKILASELGLDTLLSFFNNNLFGNILPENSTTEGYGDEQLVQFDGYSRNLSPKELDTELWRRLVINAWWLFKSKGHRKVLEFFLNLFGISECLVSLDECIYIAKNRLDVDETLNNLADYLELAPEEISLNDYPIDEYGFPKVFENSLNYYYQLNGFWYNGGNLSELGNNPHIGPYDYGKEYLSSLECFIDDFNGVTSGLTTFNTLENLFTDYENGTIESGVSDYGEEYATILNDSGMVSPGIVVTSAGAYGDNTYNGGKSFRVTFTLDQSNCNLTCPETFISYDNGLIISVDDIDTQPTTTEELTDLFFNGTITDQNNILNGAQISEVCCTEIGGFYLPISSDDGSTLVPTDSNNFFTVQQLFDVDESETKEIPFGCYWCPPTKIVCLQYCPNPKACLDEICTIVTLNDEPITNVECCRANNGFINDNGICQLIEVGDGGGGDDPGDGGGGNTNSCKIDLTNGSFASAQNPQGLVLFNGQPLAEECCSRDLVGFGVNWIDGQCFYEGFGEGGGFNISQCTNNLTFTDIETQDTLTTVITFNDTLPANQRDCCLYYSQTVDSDYFWDDVNERCIREESLICSFGQNLGGSFTLEDTFGSDITGLPVTIQNADCVCGGGSCTGSVTATETKDIILNLTSGVATINIDMFGGNINAPNCGASYIFGGTGFGVQLLDEFGSVGLGDRVYDVGINISERDCWRITEPGTYTIRVSVLPYFSDNNNHRITVTVT